jgi:subtilisin-like proprotein convertase family protein
VQSTIDLSGCTITPSSTSTVEVHIIHTYIGDLVVSLIAPDGSVYVLQSRSGGGTDNIDQTYSVTSPANPSPAPGPSASRTPATIDTGYINSWKLSL